MHAPDSSQTAHELLLTEYRSLRETVQQRGSLRIVVALVTWCVWAGLALSSWTNTMPPLAGALSLVVLFGGFELVLSLHTGVERVGRYIQQMFESGQLAPPAWEHVAMHMGSRWLSPGGLDPLFSVVFVSAIFLNALPTISTGTTPEVIGAVALHGALVVRVLMARRFVKKQRAHDLAALEQAISSNSLVSKIQQGR